MYPTQTEILWEVANRILHALLSNPAFSTLSPDELVATSFRIARRVCDTLQALRDADQEGPAPEHRRTIH
ncbi:MAG: hypothetical protein D6720_07790 [Gammaproteobacteria bacterium]|nr:MAG: hypothetical protein D6720_07790 [Gammaproteobacteria bacterium]